MTPPPQEGSEPGECGQPSPSPSPRQGGGHTRGRSAPTAPDLDRKGSRSAGVGDGGSPGRRPGEASRVDRALPRRGGYPERAQGGSRNSARLPSPKVIGGVQQNTHGTEGKRGLHGLRGEGPGSRGRGLLADGEGTLTWESLCSWSPLIPEAAEGLTERSRREALKKGEPRRAAADAPSPDATERSPSPQRGCVTD